MSKFINSKIISKKPGYQKGGKYYNTKFGSSGPLLGILCRNCGYAYGEHMGNDSCPDLHENAWGDIGEPESTEFELNKNIRIL
jgi:hypothetical protein